MPEAFVLETLRTTRTKASPRGGLAGHSEARGGRYGIAAVSGTAGLGVAALVERVAA